MSRVGSQHVQRQEDAEDYSENDEESRAAEVQNAQGRGVAEESAVAEGRVQLQPTDSCEILFTPDVFSLSV